MFRNAPPSQHNASDESNENIKAVDRPWGSTNAHKLLCAALVLNVDISIIAQKRLKAKCE